MILIFEVQPCKINFGMETKALTLQASAVTVSIINWFQYSLICGPMLEDQGIRTSWLESRSCEFIPWSGQTIDFKIDTCRFLAWRSALGYSKDWLAQCQDNVTEWDNRSWCWQPGVPVRQHYKIAMCTHCHKSIPQSPWACPTTVKHSFIPHQTTNE